MNWPILWVSTITVLFCLECSVQKKVSHMFLSVTFIPINTRAVPNILFICCLDWIAHNTHTIVLLLFWNLSRTTWVSRYQKDKTRKGKTNLDLLEQEIVSGSGICWAICKSAPHSRQPHQHPTTQFFYRPDALPAAQPTASKHWRPNVFIFHQIIL